MNPGDLNVHSYICQEGENSLLFLTGDCVYSDTQFIDFSTGMKIGS